MPIWKTLRNVLAFNAAILGIYNPTKQGIPYENSKFCFGTRHVPLGVYV